MQSSHRVAHHSSSNSIRGLGASWDSAAHRGKTGSNAARSELEESAPHNKATLATDGLLGDRLTHSVERYKGARQHHPSACTSCCCWSWILRQRMWLTLNTYSCAPQALYVVVRSTPSPPPAPLTTTLSVESFQRLTPSPQSGPKKLGLVFSALKTRRSSNNLRFPHMASVRKDPSGPTSSRSVLVSFVPSPCVAATTLYLRPLYKDTVNVVPQYYYIAELLLC